MEIKELEDKMKKTLQELKECVELSIEIRTKQPDSKRRIDRYWEQFLGHFIEYVKRREKESGEELIKNISLTKMFKFW